MKAALVSRYGPPDVVTVCEAPKPVPQADEVLIRVRATTVNRTDWGELQPGPARIVFGLLRPRRQIFGMDVAGEVESVGDGVTAFSPGDRVFGLCPLLRNGAHAEYVCVPADKTLTTMPAKTPFHEAVVCEGAYYADAGLRKFNVGPSSTVLIYGASGAIGSAAVMLAKARGANGTAVVATRHLDMARSLGADRVIDYTAEDFTAIPERFDYVMDAVGKTTYARCKHLLKPDGVFTGTDLGLNGGTTVDLLVSAIKGDNKCTVPLQRRGAGPAFIAYLKGLMEEGKYRAMIDRRYRLDQIVEAYRYVATGQKAGIVVIDVA